MRIVQIRLGVVMTLAHPVRNRRQPTEPTKRGLNDHKEQSGAKSSQGKYSDAIKAFSQQRKKEKCQLQDEKCNHDKVDGRCVYVFVDTRGRVGKKDVVAINKMLQKNVD